MTERDLGYEIERAIDHATAAILENVLWPLNEGETIDRATTLEAIGEEIGSDTDAIGLALEQKLTVIEEYGEDLAEEMTFDLDTLRNRLEALATHAINVAARQKATAALEDFFDVLEDYELECAKISTSDTYGFLPHRAEREVGPCVVYEYRNVDEPGSHIDVWHYRLEGYGSLYIEVSL